MSANFSTIITIIISAASLITAVYVAISNSKKNDKQETKSDASEMTTVIVKLENIGNGIAEIKSEMKTIKTDMKEDHDRIIRVEESAKQAHKRIDELQHNHE
ncbi:MAG: hypothetical protein J6C46_11710 [Clostridia bacterium]|nr:hypothetical protein [Clostridia bacterium]